MLPAGGTGRGTSRACNTPGLPVADGLGGLAALCYFLAWLGESAAPQSSPRVRAAGSHRVRTMTAWMDKDV